ncbi:uncharacterized protein BX663DRAFT_496360 [Cokeromyces recurvatus]|uniref:uncharacterized protein n=1 Tax=Cokeromyces recurvatus TaxID=90255 RepID=UPI00221F4522|nr:uncharacterized protein BX663DRAFT_496360 [Cokeromyces recurvatus]KAI7906422.1 hypothetical protein BX663DRAFT_496360 [Cokeromyces recurvatus]
MTSSPLKITLKLSGPKSAEISQPPSPASNKNINIKEDDTSSVDSPRKKSKPNNSRNRKIKTEGTPVPDTPNTVEEETVDETPNSHMNRRTGVGIQSNYNNSTLTLKDLMKYKDIKVRKWAIKPLIFYTLDGAEVKIPSWQSEEEMKINEQTTEPITVSEIDQLFSSTAGEKDFRPFLCTQPGCSKAFTSYDQLQTHETNMHGTKKLVCGIDGCHKSFVTTGQLTKHRKMVHFRAARKAKLAAAAAAAEVETVETPVSALEDKDEEVIINGGDNESVDISAS